MLILCVNCAEQLNPCDGNACEKCSAILANNMMEAEKENAELLARIKELEEKLYIYEWKDIKDAPKNRRVLVGWWISNDKGEKWFYWIKGFYVTPYSLEADDENWVGDISSYVDETDEGCYHKEGWYCDDDSDGDRICPINPTHYKPITPPTQEGDK